MRLNPEMANYMKQLIQEKIPGSAIYLFGSRVDDNARGGDIDLMVITQNLVDKKIFTTIRIEFYKRFGWQKIDLINFIYEDQSTFRQLIEPQAIEL
jgi:predicted nucleotidyltransferase